MSKQCSACSRVSGSRFQSKGYDGIGKSLMRGGSAFGGYLGGEYISKQINGASTAPSDTVKGLVGAGKVLMSHVVAPLLLPDKYEEHPAVMGLCDGFGISGLKDILKVVATKEQLTKLGIAGYADLGYPAYTTTRTSTGGGGAAPKADLY